MLTSLLKGMLGTAVLTVASLETAVNLIDTQEKHETPEDSLYTMVKNSSTKTRWDYDGQQFYSENDLNDYIAKNNKIETIQTSTNPGKIINDYQYHTLDPKKVYDTNFNNYQLVYRDAFGNVSLSKEKALETYTNKGLVKAQYSYDSIKWYDSPEEAKSGFIYKAGLQKSLYYYLNGRYYNVFNNEDQEKLKSILTEGYTLHPSEFTKNETIYGTKESLKNIVHNKFKEIWDSPSGPSSSYPTLHYSNFLKVETKHTVTLSPGKDDMFRISKNNEDSKKYEHGSSVTIEDPHNDFSLDKFTSSETWTEDKEYGGTAGRYKNYWTRTFNIGKDKYRFTYLPESAGWWGTPSKFNWKNLTTSETFDTSLILYDNDKSSSNKKELFSWDKLPLNITRPSEIPTQYVRNSYDKWFDDFYENKFLNLDQGEGPWNKYNKYGVYQDVLYDVNGKQGHKYSVKASEKSYQEKTKYDFLKRETSKNDKGEVTYKLRDDFYATEEEINNYLFLSNFDTRLMYTYLNVRNLSSIDGLALATNEADAREKQFQYESGVLMKKFFAYDVFGNSMLSAESGEDAIAKLQNMISLSGKYINHKEIETWDGINYSYDNILQDGVYNVYRAYNEAKANQGLEPYLYFDTYNSALEALKAGINHKTNVSTTTINIYVYIYTDKTGGKHSYSYSTDEQIKKIVKEIMSLN